LLSNPKQDLYDAFETFSLSIKNPSTKTVSHLREHYNEIKEYIDNYRALVLKNTAEGEEGETAGAVGYLPNLAEEIRQF
jgi:hypothetical protein